MSIPLCARNVHQRSVVIVVAKIVRNQAVFTTVVRSGRGSGSLGLRVGRKIERIVRERGSVTVSSIISQPYRTRSLLRLRCSCCVSIIVECWANPDDFSANYVLLKFYVGVGTVFVNACCAIHVSVEDFATVL